MFKHYLNMEQIIEVRKWGNSGGILLPREWLGKQVKVVLVDRTQEIKKEVFRILDNYLEDIIGIYLVGSYARGEQRKDSDIDILVISKEIKKSIKSGKYEIEIIPLASVTRMIRIYPAMIYPKFVDAKVILNRSLLEEIKEIELPKDCMRLYLDDSKRIIEIDKEFIEEDKVASDVLESNSVVYSSLLRLRALFMMKVILKNEKYSNRKFQKWLVSELEIPNNEYNGIYEIYGAVRDSRKPRERVSIDLAERLVRLLEKEVNNYGKKGKKT